MAEGEEEGEEGEGSAPPWIMAGNQMFAANNDRGEISAAVCSCGDLSGHAQAVIRVGLDFFLAWERDESMWSCQGRGGNPAPPVGGLDGSVNERTGSGGCCVLKHSSSCRETHEHIWFHPVRNQVSVPQPEEIYWTFINRLVTENNENIVDIYILFQQYGRTELRDKLMNGSFKFI